MGTTTHRGYTEIPGTVAPDVPLWVNTALDDIDADVESVEALISAGDAGTLQAAKDHVTAALSGALRIMPNLGTEDLNTITAPGVYPQAVSGNATAARNYPFTTSGRGDVTVRTLGGGIIAQEYFATFLKKKAYREFDGTAWSAWVDPLTGASDSLRIMPNLGTEDLNTLKTAGIYPQAVSGNATAARNYPFTSGGRGIATVVKVSASQISQEYYATFLGRKAIREFDGTTWSAWKETTATDPALVGKIADAEAELDQLAAVTGNHTTAIAQLQAASGGNPITGAVAVADGLIAFTLADGTQTAPVAVPAGLPTAQADYLEQVRRRVSGRRLLLTKTADNNALEISCIAPNGIHTTYAFQGAATGPSADDYRIQAAIWVGTSSAGKPNKTTAVGPLSNRDFALQIAPEAGGTPTFVPYHGVPTAFAAEPAKLYNAGAEINLDVLPVGGTLDLDAFELVQHVYGRHPDQPGVNLIEIWTSQRVTADGVLAIDGRWKALQNVRLGSNYVMMCPVTGSAFDRMLSSLNNAYPNNAGLYGTSTALPVESDVATSYLFLSSTRKDLAVAFRYNNIAETMRRGRPDKNPQGTKAFLEHRNADFLKLYNRPYLAGTLVPAGTVHRFSGDYLYVQSPGLFDQLAQ